MKLKIDNIDSRLQGAIKICSLISADSYKAYIVGGFVRDLIIGNSVDYDDIDIATNMPIDMLKQKFKTQSNNGESHGTILVFSNGIYYEVTQFRSESTYSDGRRPDDVKFVFSFREDSERRDFTINAFGLESDFHVMDHHKGIQDLRNKLIRCVGNAEERFSEDYLRMLRAIRFAAKLNFAVEDTTLGAITKLAPNIKKISRERIHTECLKACKFEKQQIKYFFKLLNYTGLFQNIFEIDINYDYSFLSGYKHVELPYVMFGIFKKINRTIDYKKCFKAPLEEVSIYETLLKLDSDKSLDIDFKIINHYAKSQAYASICKNYIADDEISQFINRLNKILDDLYIETESKDYKSAISKINALARSEDLSGKAIGDFVEDYVNNVIKQYSDIKPFSY